MELAALAPVCQETVVPFKIRTYVAAKLSIFHRPPNHPPVCIWESRCVCGGLPHSFVRTVF
jgi:hypothetical protein